MIDKDSKKEKSISEIKERLGKDMPRLKRLLVADGTIVDKVNIDFDLEGENKTFLEMVKENEKNVLYDMDRITDLKEIENIAKSKYIKEKLIKDLDNAVKSGKLIEARKIREKIYFHIQEDPNLRFSGLDAFRKKNVECVVGEKIRPLVLEGIRSFVESDVESDLTDYSSNND